MRIWIIASLLLTQAAAAQDVVKAPPSAPTVMAKPCARPGDPDCPRIMGKRPPPPTTLGGGGIQYRHSPDDVRGRRRTSGRDLAVSPGIRTRSMAR